MIKRLLEQNLSTAEPKKTKNSEIEFRFTAFRYEFMRPLIPSLVSPRTSLGPVFQTASQKIGKGVSALRDLGVAVGSEKVIQAHHYHIQNRASQAIHNTTQMDN